MTTLKVSNYDAISGELEVREMTAEEIAQYEADAERQNAIVETSLSAKESTLAKLEALGLTAEDLKALGLG
jgi:hypothetical protein